VRHSLEDTGDGTTRARGAPERRKAGGGRGAGTDPRATADRLHAQGAADKARWEAPVPPVVPAATVVQRSDPYAMRRCNAVS